jgi:hypothetical protein
MGLLATNGIRLLPRPRDQGAPGSMGLMGLMGPIAASDAAPPESWILAPQTRAEFAHRISRSIRLNASARRVSST